MCCSFTINCYVGSSFHSTKSMACAILVKTGVNIAGKKLQPPPALKQLGTTSSNHFVVSFMFLSIKKRHKAAASFRHFWTCWSHGWPGGNLYSFWTISCSRNNLLSHMMKNKAHPHLCWRALGGPRAPVRDRSPHTGLLGTSPTGWVRPSPLGDPLRPCCGRWGLLWDAKKEDSRIAHSTYYGMLREGIKGWERICGEQAFSLAGRHGAAATSPLQGYRFWQLLA